MNPEVYPTSQDDSNYIDGFEHGQIIFTEGLSNKTTNHQYPEFRDTLKKFVKYKKEDKSKPGSVKLYSLKPENFEKSIERYVLNKIIKRVLEHKKIKDGKIVYNICNIESTTKRNIIIKFILENKKVFNIIIDPKSNERFSKKHESMFKSDEFCYIYEEVVELIFYRNNPKEEYKQSESSSENDTLKEVYKPDELQDKLAISCCKGSHSKDCYSLWDQLKKSLLKKVRPGQTLPTQEDISNNQVEILDNQEEISYNQEDMLMIESEYRN